MTSDPTGDPSQRPQWSPAARRDPDERPSIFEEEMHAAEAPALPIATTDRLDAEQDRQPAISSPIAAARAAYQSAAALAQQAVMAAQAGQRSAMDEAGTLGARAMDAADAMATSEASIAAAMAAAETASAQAMAMVARNDADTATGPVPPSAPR